MQHFIVERSFSPPLTDGALEAVKQRMAPCLELHRVQWLRSHLSADRQRMVCEYQANDAESVRTVQHEAEAGFDRIWPASVLLP